MADFHDEDDHGIVANAAQHAIVTDPVPPEPLAPEGPSKRARALSPQDTLCHEAHDRSGDLAVQLVELPDGPFGPFDPEHLPVSHDARCPGSSVPRHPGQRLTVAEALGPLGRPGPQPEGVPTRIPPIRALVEPR